MPVLIRGAGQVHVAAGGHRDALCGGPLVQLAQTAGQPLHRAAMFARRLFVLASAAEKVRATGAEAITFALDVTDSSALSDAVGRLEKMTGGIDLLVANAGTGQATPAEDLDRNVARKMIDLNVRAFTDTVALVLPMMLKRGTGHIVALSSLAAFRGLPGNAVYCAGKAFVATFMESLRADLSGTGVHTTTVYPGWVKTDMVKKNTHKMPQLLTPEKVAKRIWRAIEKKETNVALPFPLSWITRMGRYIPAPLFDVAMKGKRRPFDK